MIVPLVSEEEWLVRLSNFPILSDTQALFKGPILIVAPHPDDETLGAGGLIAHLRCSGIEVLVAAVTDGENAYGESSVLGDIRATEQTAALARLGVEQKNIYRLKICDSDVSSYEGALEAMLAPLVAQCSHVMSAWRGDFHPDHEACGRVAERLAQIHKVQLTSYFFWTWHSGTAELLDGLNLVRFPLSAELLKAKDCALRCHHSQLHRDSGDAILPDRSLAPAYRSFETFLRSGVPDAS